MHVDVPGYDVTTCAQIIQAGYRVHERVLRPARVAVTDPSEPAPSEPAEPVTETETVPQPDTES